MSKTFRDSLTLVEAEQITENASAGATSAASVATLTGGASGPALGTIGVGFDPNGDQGIYGGKPKKAQTGKPAIIKRMP